jgi:alcohol dehydrogenase, propanol-preferring
MKAAVLTAFRQPFEIRDLPDPSPGPADAVIKVEACGICRSDWHIWQGDLTCAGFQFTLPCVPGHEHGGTVQEVARRSRPSSRPSITFVEADLPSLS